MSSERSLSRSRLLNSFTNRVRSPTPTPSPSRPIRPQQDPSQEPPAANTPRLRPTSSLSDLSDDFQELSLNSTRPMNQYNQAIQPDPDSLSLYSDTATLHSLVTVESGSNLFSHLFVTIHRHSIPGEHSVSFILDALKEMERCSSGIKEEGSVPLLRALQISLEATKDELMRESQLRDNKTLKKEAKALRLSKHSPWYPIFSCLEFFRSARETVLNSEVETKLDLWCAKVRECVAMFQDKPSGRTRSRVGEAHHEKMEKERLASEAKHFAIVRNLLEKALVESPSH
ncbi:hypothetical protein T439DRAFT_381777 [Meredithblackwellia eburnea MCA 4105]